jgi:hypothetical protein
MEHVSYFLNDCVACVITEHKNRQLFFNDIIIGNLWDVYRRNNYYACQFCLDLEYVLEQKRELQVLLSVCKNMRMLLNNKFIY